VSEDSSGNGGAAVAGYAAGGMRATIMTPASTSPGKPVQMPANGVEIRLIAGFRQDSADAANLFCASHNWHPFFLHDTKTLAYEIWEDLDFRVPDNIVTPCGAGSNVLGCALGFPELLRAGEIDRLPSLGIYVEPTSAQVAAAFRTLLARRTIGKGDTTVLVMAGCGLKATGRIAERMGIQG
jgi:threonine synthase